MSAAGAPRRLRPATLVVERVVGPPFDDITTVPSIAWAVRARRHGRVLVSAVCPVLVPFATIVGQLGWRAFDEGYLVVAVVPGDAPQAPDATDGVPDLVGRYAAHRAVCQACRPDGPCPFGARLRLVADTLCRLAGLPAAPATDGVGKAGD